MASEYDLISGLLRSQQYNLLQSHLAVAKKRNLFHVLEDVFSENCSSRLLRYLLDSNEDHSLGMIPFFAVSGVFAAALDGKFNRAIKRAKSTNAVFNWRTPAGRFLDILVTGFDEQKNFVFAIGIENKIESEEQQNQIMDYQEALLECFRQIPTLMV